VPAIFQSPSRASSSPQPGFPHGHQPDAKVRSRLCCGRGGRWKAERSHSGSPDSNTDTFAASDLCDISECKQGLSDKTGRQRVAQTEEEMHIFHTTSAQLSVISPFAESFKICLQLKERSYLTLTPSNGVKQAKHKPCFASNESHFRFCLVRCFLQCSLRKAKLVKVS